MPGYYTVFDTVDMTEKKMLSREVVELIAPIRKVRKGCDLFSAGMNKAVVDRYVIVKPDRNRGFKKQFAEEWEQVCSRLRCNLG